MTKTVKTNAVRLLDKAGIYYELIPYIVDENNLDAKHVAYQLGENPAQLFKTLVLRGDRTGYFVCVIPGDMEVNLKKAATVSGNKYAELISMKDLFSVTGYVRGGCSPVGMKRKLTTYFDMSFTSHPLVYVSAGTKGLQIKIRPEELLAYLESEVADLV